MTAAPTSFRLAASTGIHKGDRPYQQDQVDLVPHARVKGCVMAIVADGMGGKSGGRKAADQVILTARQVFEKYIPSKDEGAQVLAQLVHEAHLMIKLTAIAFEEEPHSTLASYIINPDLSADIVHAGDSRVYHFRGANLQYRTLDHSFVQRLVNEGQITEEEANVHPQSNLLTGCLGTQQDPPIAAYRIRRLEIGDTLIACSDGLWHYFTPRKWAQSSTPCSLERPQKSAVTKARHRARGVGDNLSLVIVKIEPMA